MLVSCVGEQPTLCAATTDLEVDIPSLKEGWKNDGEGPTVYGCPPRAPTSIRTNECYSADETVSYRTRGIYVFVWGATVVDAYGTSPTKNLRRLC